MKKITALLLILALAFSTALSACTNDTPDSENDDGKAEATEVFTGTVSEIFESITAKSGVQDFDTFDEALTNENSDYTVGLSSDDVDTYVEDGIVSVAAMMTSAHLASLIKAKDAESAAKIAGIIAENFDPYRWVCVMPNQCTVITAGNYVLLVASNGAIAQGYLRAFKSLAGDAAGEENTFYNG